MGEGLEAMLAWMEKNGNCAAQKRSALNWDFWGSTFFALTIATTVIVAARRIPKG